MRSPKGRLELTWMGKDMALIPTAHGKYDYEWVDPADPRACEIKSIEVVDTVGEQVGPNGAVENLLTSRQGPWQGPCRSWPRITHRASRTNRRLRPGHHHRSTCR